MTINLADLNAAQLNFAINYTEPKSERFNFVFEVLGAVFAKMVRTLKLI